MRRFDNFVRGAPDARLPNVRDFGLIAHSATRLDRRSAPFAAISAVGDSRNRRKCSDRSESRAHCAECGVRGLVGKRSDAHNGGAFVRNRTI
ncbi:MAG: hypothetical protein C0483_17200 [Pirellula sp.]|nr:hypothetical protein [Pirellula sp.]